MTFNLEKCNDLLKNQPQAATLRVFFWLALNLHDQTGFVSVPLRNIWLNLSISTPNPCIVLSNGSKIITSFINVVVTAFLSLCSRLTSSSGATIDNLASTSGITVGDFLISASVNKKASDFAPKVSLSYLKFIFC